jgi:hypothetical protein
MSFPELQEANPDKGSSSGCEHPELENLREVLQQLFELLEQYSPIWFTEEYRNRAMTALRGASTKRASEQSSFER